MPWYWIRLPAVPYPCEASWKHCNDCNRRATSHYTYRNKILGAVVLWVISSKLISNSNLATSRSYIHGSCPMGLTFRTEYDGVIKCKHFSRYWPFVCGIHRSKVSSPYKGQWRGALMFSLICVWINDWVNNRDAGDLRRWHAHYDVTVMARQYRFRALCKISKPLDNWE